MMWKQHWLIMGYLCISTPKMQRLHRCGIRGPMGSLPLQVLTHITHSFPHFDQGIVLDFRLLGQQFIFEATTCIYHFDMFPILRWVCFGLGYFCNIFIMHVTHTLLFKTFYLCLCLEIHSHIFLYVYLMKLSKKLLQFCTQTKKHFFIPKNKQFKPKKKTIPS